MPFHPAIAVVIRRFKQESTSADVCSPDTERGSSVARCSLMARKTRLSGSSHCRLGSGSDWCIRKKPGQRRGYAPVALVARPANPSGAKRGSTRLRDANARRETGFGILILDADAQHRRGDRRLRLARFLGAMRNVRGSRMMICPHCRSSADGECYMSERLAALCGQDIPGHPMRVFSRMVLHESSVHELLDWRGEAFRLRAEM